MNKILKKFRDKLNNQEFVYGVFTKSQDPMFVEIQGISNFDFVILDCEHGPSNVSEQQNNIRAALLRNMLPIIRVNEISENNIGKAFDIGALGIQVPQIETAEQAKKVVEYSRFYPYGERGLCRFVRAADYSAKDRNLYFEESKDLIIILQLEGLKAIENIDDILDVDGVDIIFIGPYDLSQSLGVPGDIKNPKVLNAMINLVEKAKAKNKIVGTFTDDYEMVEKWKSLGVQYISYSTDSGLFFEYTRDTYNILCNTGIHNSKCEVLDCTLRDGGYVNDWKFGLKNIKHMINSLEESKVSYIECGFLADQEYINGSSKFSSIEYVNKLISKKTNINYALMINYGKFDIEHLPQYIGYGVNCIRVAFHKKDLSKALDYCSTVKAKGYNVFVQAMVTSSYSDAEYEYLIKRCNEIKPYALYIADSFGNMKRKDVLHYFKLLERMLDNDIYPGFHSHNNLQLSLSNVISLLDNANRKFIVDSSIYGMGRGAGNLNTELLLQYLNENYNDEYKLEPVLEIMDSVLNKVYAKTPWGYTLPNYLSACYNAHPNYAKHLIDKNNLTLNDMNNIFNMLDQNKKVEFDKNYIEEIYLAYLERNFINDNDDFNKLAELLSNKKISVIAPGKSLEKNTDKIIEDKKNGFIIISINFNYDDKIIDYIFVGNIKRIKDIDDKYKNKMIITSNIPTNNVLAKINYSSLLNSQDYVKDNSGLMLIKLLIKLNCDIKVYGMDGYTYNIEENYTNNDLELATNKLNVDHLNLGINIVKKQFVDEYSKISFIK